MSKYRSREEPVPGSSVSETHPLYWADHIQLERKITSRWNKNYGHLYNECQLEPPSLSCSSEKKPPEYVRQGYESTTEYGQIRAPDRQVTPSESTAFLKMHNLKRDHQDSGDWSPVIQDAAPGDSSDYHRLSARSHYSLKMPNMYCDYSTPGNTQQHHVVKDPVTSYSESFGHHSTQFKQNSAHQGQIETYTSAPDYLIQNRSCPHESVNCDYLSLAMPSDPGRCPECPTEYGQIRPPDCQVSPSEPTAFLKMHMLKSDHQYWSPVIQDAAPADSSDYHRFSAPSHYSPKKPNMYSDYSTPGNTQEHNVVKDPVTSYSEFFGHHSTQFKQNSAHQGQIETYTSAPDYLIQNRSCPHESVNCDYPSSAMPSDSGRCPECLLLRCICVPRRRQKIPEDSESRPWSPEIRRNQSYRANRCSTEGDILRLRLRLSRDPLN